jgi:uncharacterized protein YjbJ (UPF0337 family)
MMETDVLKGMWKQVRGEAKSKWGKLTDDELDQVEGERDKLLGLLQEKYGYAKVKAEQEINEFLHEHRESSS